MRSWPTSPAPSPTRPSILLDPAKTLTRMCLSVHTTQAQTSMPLLLQFPRSGMPFPLTLPGSPYSSCKGDPDCTSGLETSLSPLAFSPQLTLCSQQLSGTICLCPLSHSYGFGFCFGLSDTLSGAPGFIPMRPERAMATTWWHKGHRAEQCSRFLIN